MTWRREDETHLALEGDDLIVRRYQDSEDIADRAKMLREQPNRGDFHHKWSAPNVLVDQLFQEYCGDTVKCMDDEFWQWMHKKMQDPEYRVFWCHDPQSQMRVGYNGPK
jgi:hypothetical protein